jgi:small neutral amino acid transporter SnatA (MarC family)
MEINFKDLLTVSFTLFAVIDIVGAVPVLISLNTKLGGINEFRATLVSGGLMILFLYIGEPFLNLLALIAGFGTIERILGPAGLIAVRKFFGVVLLAIAVKIFTTNAQGLIK